MNALPPSPPALELRGLSHTIGPQVILERIDFTLPPRRLACIVGPSGCGKSTLLGLIGGLAAPAGGDIHRAATRPAHVFQDPCLLPWRTALDNAAFGLKAEGMGRCQRRRRAAALLETLGLGEDDLGKYPHELSGGMRQRVALARALVVAPDLLLLDEPFSALDAGLRRQMQALLRQQLEAHPLTALLVTHDLAEAVRLGDRILVLTGRPARVAGLHDIDRPFAERDDGFVLAETGRLLARPEIAAALSLDQWT